MPRQTPEDSNSDAEFEEFTDQELTLAKQAEPTAYSFLGASLREGFVYSARTIVGCFAAVAIAPRALPYVINYLGPSVAIPGGVALGTTTAVVGVFSFGAGGKIGTAGAEATLALSEKAISLVWGTSPNIYKPIPNPNEKTEKVKKPNKFKM